MANLSPQDLTARTQQVMADPRVAQAWASWKAYHDRSGVWNPGHGVGGPQNDFYNAVRATGLMPEGYQVGYGADGAPTLEHKGLPSWVYPLAAAGIALTAGAATGAFSGAFGAGSAVTSGGGSAAAGLGPQAAGAAYPGAGLFGAPATAASSTASTGGSGILGTVGRFLGGNGTGNSTVDTAGRVGRGLLGIEADRQAGRQAEAVATLAQDRNAIAAANVNLTAGSHRGAQSVQGDVMANGQPFKWTGENQMVGNIPVPQFTGGVSPALFSDSTRRLGTQLSADALASQTLDHGSPVDLTPLPHANAADSILTTAGRIGGLMSLIPYRRPQTTPAPQGWA